MIEDIKNLIKEMSPVLIQMDVAKQFQVPEKALDLPYEVVQKAFRWISSKHKDWSIVNHYYRRHPPEDWDNLLDLEFPLNEVECYLRESAKFRKLLKKRPDFFKPYVTKNLLRKKHGNTKRSGKSSTKD